MILRLLLFLWFPLSVGKLDYLNGLVNGDVAIQHFLMIIFLVYAIGFSLKKGGIYRINLYFLLFFSYISINGLIMNFSAEVCFRIFAVFGVYQLAYSITRQMDFEEFLQILCWSSVVFLALSFLYIVLLPTESFEQLQDRQVISSFFSHKNAYGRFLQLSYLFLFSGWMIFRKRVYLLSAMLAISGLLLSDSRTSLAVSALSTSIMLLAYFRLEFVRYILLSLAFICLGAAYLWFAGKVEVFRIGSIYDGLSTLGMDILLTGRVTIWDAVLSEINQRDNWAFGFGLGLFFGDNVANVLGDVGLGDFIPNDAHNGYIDLLVNVGVVGVMLHFYAMWGLMRKLWFPDSSRPLQVAFGTSFIVCFFLANMTESYIIKSTNIYTFLFWVIMLFLSKHDQNTIHIGTKPETLVSSRSG